MQTLSFSLILRIGSTAIRKCSHLLYPTASLERRTQDSESLEPQSSPSRQSRSAPGIHPGQGPFTQIPAGPGKDKADTFTEGLAISHHPAAAWETARQSLGPHPAEGPRFSGLAPGSYGGPGHTDQPVLVTVTPLCIPVAFALALGYCGCFQCEAGWERAGLEVCSDADSYGRRMAPLAHSQPVHCHRSHQRATLRRRWSARAVQGCRHQTASLSRSSPNAGSVWAVDRLLGAWPWVTLRDGSGSWMGGHAMPAASPRGSHHT